MDTYTTSDLYFACVLKTLDFVLLSVDTVHDGKKSQKTFKFMINEDTADQLKNDYVNDNMSINPKKFVSAIKDMKMLIYGDK